MVTFIIGLIIGFFAGTIVMLLWPEKIVMQDPSDDDYNNTKQKPW